MKISLLTPLPSSWRFSKLAETCVRGLSEPVSLSTSDAAVKLVLILDGEGFLGVDCSLRFRLGELLSNAIVDCELLRSLECIVRGLKAGSRRCMYGA